MSIIIAVLGITSRLWKTGQRNSRYHVENKILTDCYPGSPAASTKSTPVGSKSLIGDISAVGDLSRPTARGGVSMMWQDHLSEMEGLLAALGSQDSAVIRASAESVLESAYKHVHNAKVPLGGDGEAMSTLIVASAELDAVQE